jgi:hypothetical protein
MTILSPPGEQPGVLQYKTYNLEQGSKINL